MVSNIVTAQAPTNLLTNPGLESGTSGERLPFPWQLTLVGDVDLNGRVDFGDIPAFIAVLQSGGYQIEADANEDGELDFADIPPFIQIIQGDDTRTVETSSDNCVEGDQAALLDLGAGIGSRGFSQVVSVVEGRSYIFSASVFFDDDEGRSRLVVRNEVGQVLEEETNQSFTAVQGVWEKAQVKFTAKEDGQVRLFIRSEDSTGKTYFDAVKVFEAGGGRFAGSNLLANDDFEDGRYWDFSDANAIRSDDEKRFGDYSLKLDATGGASAMQEVFLNNYSSFASAPDQSIFTLSAHIKTTGQAPSPETSGSPNDIDWGDASSAGNDFDVVAGAGAAFKVECFAGQDPLRTIYSPYFYSESDNFTERKFSFLIPKFTSRLEVTALVSDGNFQAYFDNVQLKAWEASGLVQNVGNKEVEAPEPGTYVEVTGSIQDAVDTVTSIGGPDYGKLVWVGAGEYRQREVLLVSTTHLKMHKDAILIKNSGALTGASQWFGAQVKSKVCAVPATDVIIEGGTLDNRNGAIDYPGSAVAMFGDRVIIRNVNIPRYSRKPDDTNPNDLHSASAIFLMGHHTYVYDNFISGGKEIIGQDGIHLWGGTHSHIMSNRVLAPDDGLGLFTGTVSSFANPQQDLIAIFDRNISDIEAYNNIFNSVGARCIGLGLARPRNDSQRLTCSVSDVRIRNFEGVCGGIHPQVIVLCVPFVTDDAGQLLIPPPPGNDDFFQVRNIRIANASVEGYMFQAPDGVEDAIHPPSARRGPGYTGQSLGDIPRLPPYGLRVFTDDVGQVDNVRFANITTRRFQVHNGTSAVFDVTRRAAINVERLNQRVRVISSVLGDSSSTDRAEFDYSVEGLRWNIEDEAEWDNRFPNGQGGRFFERALNGAPIIRPFN